MLVSTCIISRLIFSKQYLNFVRNAWIWYVLRRYYASHLKKDPLRLDNNNIFIIFRFSRTTNTNICLTAYQCTQKKNSKEICLWCLTMNSCSWTSHKIWIQKIILSISFKISDDKCNTQILKDFKIIKQNMLVINQFRMWFIIRIYVCIKLIAQIVLFITTFILNTSGNKVVNPIRCMGNRHT